MKLVHIYKISCSKSAGSHHYQACVRIRVNFIRMGNAKLKRMVGFRSEVVRAEFV
jgi:hypothetical protein